MPPISWQLATVKDIRVENPTVKTFTLTLPHWSPYQAGQHYDIRLTAPDGYQAERSYSIASEPGQTGIIELTVEKLDEGEISSFLHDGVIIGDQLEIRGPIGGYFIWKPEQTRSLLLLAGGSGVVPLMSMIRHRAATGADVFITLLYSVRSPQQVIYADELMERAQQDKDLEVIFAYTRTAPEQWTGYQQRLDETILKQVLQKYATPPVAYICGPTAFVENVANILVGLGLPATDVLTERFGPTGR